MLDLNQILRAMYRQENSAASIGLARSWNCAVLETCLGVGGIAPIVAEQSHAGVAAPCQRGYKDHCL